MRHLVFACTLGAGAALCGGLAHAQPSATPLAMATTASATARAMGEREPAGLRAAAQAGFNAMVADLLANIPEGELPDGFPAAVGAAADLRQAKLGLGFEVYSTEPKALLVKGAQLDRVLAGTGVWQFVVQHGPRAVALLEVQRVEGRWQAVALGGAELAQDVMATVQSQGPSQGFRFVRVYQATADFFETVDAQGAARYWPLVAARRTMRLPMPVAADGRALGLSSAQLTPLLQNATRNHLASFGQ